MDDIPANTRRYTKRQAGDLIASSLDAVVRDPLGGARAKKRKTSTPTPRTSTPALEAILSRSSTHKPPASSATAPTNYDPSSLPALLARLSTYRLSTFSPSKPSSLSSLNCALHGWIHTPSSRERIQCTTCAQGLVLLPPSNGESWSSPTGDRLRLEYERLALAPTGHGHAENCPWRMRPCVRGLYRLAGGGLGVQSGGRRRFLETVGRQARELSERGLDAVTLELPREAAALVESEEGRARLVKAVQAVQAGAGAAPAVGVRTDEAASLDATAILLAVFGWALSTTPSPSTLSRSDSTSSLSSLRSLSTSSTSSSSPILACSFCVRHILATPYLPSPAGTATTTTSTTTPSSTPRPFDPVKQHQPFCPFVDAHAGHSPPVAAPLSAGAGAGSGAGAGAKGASVLKPGWQTKELLSYVRGLLGPKGTPRGGAASVRVGTTSAGRSA
ncbi:uncharacterized protein RHOBADRAFT_55101 [Rhodotorula graminis WP1]|uniref:C3HC-type domain-containing protein n=1 Tax=Rhodotorula graminis (strain WP1) TaxID=578459 RepID=A0A0P9H0I3_RHOGW|nr:uncharacterized protein RHOBADRAFT_55101 [Rhodotorula graminis WP1]KPV73343.1 hypothetical protein RHOBADRAFT_55101 [Rhodotorula graminis WP1]